MDYWKGIMNWPIDYGWECEVCGYGPARAQAEMQLFSAGLTWGLVHAECRCDRCHAVYTMRNSEQEGRPRVTRPILMVKATYLEAAQKAWQRWSKSLDALSDDEWREVGAPV